MHPGLQPRARCTAIQRTWTHASTDNGWPTACVAQRKLNALEASPEGVDGQRQRAARNQLPLNRLGVATHALASCLEPR